MQLTGFWKVSSQWCKVTLGLEKTYENLLWTEKSFIVEYKGPEFATLICDVDDKSRVQKSLAGMETS